MAKEFTQEHIIKLCLPPELYLAIINFQAKKEIGKPFAGLLLITKGLYQDNLISREVYEKFLYRYSRKLVPDEEPKQLSLEQQNEQKKMEAMARSFWNVLDQWEEHPEPKWRLYWINEARKWQHRIPEARELLEKVSG